ncbi:AMIN-like domain-containing (lipo)protein [Tsukamurella ocularis]|uniref:AMIN-like domain-containing (lipo)protein n=1 Tax=Tsukamurella ocularis TaxID=1970234 RepID=UPI0039F0BE73
MSVRTIHRSVSGATVLVLGAMLAACDGSGPVTAPSGIGRPSVTTVTGAAPSSTGTATSAPRSAPATTSASVAPGATMLKDLRTGASDGADRVVLEFTGAVPPYRVTRDAGPVLDCGSGAVLGGPGEYLVVRVEPVAIFDDAGKSAYTGERGVAGPGRAVSRAIITCSFEGQLQVALKLTGNAQRYADSTLTGPGRIVVDVQQ